MTVTSAPYHSTFDASKNYLQVLFRPEYEVQVRELNELQQILSDQISKVGMHLFKNGTPIIGGEASVQTVWYAKLQPTFQSNPVNVSLFAGQKIVEKNSSDVATGVTAKVVAVRPATGSDPITVYFVYDGSNSFVTEGNRLYVDASTIGATMQSGAGSIGQANLVTLNAGVFFLNNYFVDVPAQSMVLEPYDANSNGKVGLSVEFYAVDEQDDPQLLDIASGYPSYGAEGAHRLAATATLTYVPSGSATPNSFATLLELERGVNTVVTGRTVYSEIAKELARRTYDESGDYTVRPYSLNLADDDRNYVVRITKSGNVATAICARPHGLSVGSGVTVTGETGPDAALYNGFHLVASVPTDTTFTFEMSGTPSANSIGSEIYFSRGENFSVVLGPGKSYVRGFEYETVANTRISAPRARSTQRVDNYAVSTSYGSYVIVKDVVGVFDPTTLSPINLYTSVDGTGSSIGTAKIRYIQYHSGSYGNINLRTRFYLYDFKFTSTFSLADVRSMRNPSASGSLAVVASESIVNGFTTLTGSDAQAMLFRIPNDTVKTLRPAGADTVSYVAIQKFTGAASGGNVVFTASGTSSFLGPAGTNFANTDAHLSYYFAVDSTSGSLLNVSSIVLTGGNKTLTMTVSPGGASVVLYAPVIVTNAAQKVKSLTTASVNVLDGVITKGSPRYEVQYADVKSIRVFEASAPGVNATTSDPEITDRFDFDNGQRDSFYDFGSITLRGGAVPPSNRVLLRVEYFSHAGTGFFSVDSYSGIDYADIPSYNGVRLSDVVDFRPRRTTGSSHTGNALPVPNTTITADYEFYLPRRDLVVINSSDGSFQVVTGTPSLTPAPPKVPDYSMVLYRLYVPAYTFKPTDVVSTFVENKRYTMRDIGVIEKRVERMEYYTTLSLLEMNTRQKTIVDENGFERFKNGILVDSFKDFFPSAHESADFKCALDFENREMRPAFLAKNEPLVYSSGSGVQRVQTADYGEFVMLPWANEKFSENLQASKSISVQPYIVANRQATLALNPPSDDWIDTTVAPDVNVAANDQWIVDGVPIEDGVAVGFGTRWGDWTSTVTQRGDFTVTTNTRTGEETTLTTRATTTELGEFVNEVSVVPYMRAVNISFSAGGLRPNRDHHVFFDGKKVNSYVVPDSGFAPLSEGSIRTDSSGRIRGTIQVPGGTFRNGDRQVLVVDEGSGVIENATSVGTAMFSASALGVTKSSLSITTRTPEITNRTVTETRVDQVFNQPFIDPVAESFFVSSEAHPYGIFLSSVTLFFRQKSATDYVEVHLRPMVNGYPSNEVIPMSRVQKLPSQVAVPTATDDFEAVKAAGTEFEFQVPIYLEPGKEYCFVVFSPDPAYEVYVSEMGRNIIGTEQVITQQGTLGSMFRSQNKRTWTAYQNEDIMFTAKKAYFDTGSFGTVVFRNTFVDNQRKRVNLLRYSPSVIDIPPATSIASEFSGKSLLTGLMSSYERFDRNSDRVIPDEKVVDAADTFRIRNTLRTSNRDVSPMIDCARNSLVTVQNLVNNLGLLRSGIAILDGGSGFTSVPTITVTGGGGTGAALQAVMSQDGSRIEDVVITAEGQGYVTAPTITVTGGGGTGASIVYEGVETDPSGGNAKARYLTKPMVLKDNFETNYITVYADLCCPQSTSFKVFYRAAAAYDPTPIGNRPWVEIVRQGGGTLVTADGEFVETTWVPATPDISYTSGGVEYPQAKIVQVKMVPLSSNTSVVPRAKDFRLITTVNA